MNATPPEAQPEYSRGLPGSEGVLVPRPDPGVGDSGAGSGAAGGGSGAGAGAGSGAAGGAGSSAVPETDGAASGALEAALLAGGLLGALMLLVAEFTTLFEVHVAAAGIAVRSVSTGSHHSYAMALIAVLAAGLAFAVWRAASRPALLALGVLGLAALLIALLGDLPDASATGLVLTSSHYAQATSTPSAGFYLETLGAVVLLLTSVCGLLLAGPAQGGRRSAL